MSVERPTRVGGGESRVAGGFDRGRRAGFTLIELMVVILIGAMVLSVGIPNLVSKSRKDPLNQGVSDLMEACRDARGRAVLGGMPMQVVIEAGDGTIRVEPAPARGDARILNVLEKKIEQRREAAGGGSYTFSSRFHEEVAFRALVVNTKNRMADPVIAIRFYPNGTCDQFDAVLAWPKRGARRVSLEMTTGLPEVVDVP